MANHLPIQWLYLLTCKRIQLLASFATYVGDQRQLSDEYYRFVERAGSAMHTVSQWCAHEWRRATSTMGISQVELDKARENAVVEYEDIESALAITLQKLENDLSDYPEQKIAQERVRLVFVASVLYQSLAGFLEIATARQELLSPVATVQDKQIAILASVSFFRYTFLSEIDAILLANLGAFPSTLSELIMYDQLKKKALLAHLPPRLLEAQETFWHGLEPFSPRSQSLMDMELLAFAQ